MQKRTWTVCLSATFIMGLDIVLINSFFHYMFIAFDSKKHGSGKWKAEGFSLERETGNGKRKWLEKMGLWIPWMVEVEGMTGGEV